MARWKLAALALMLLASPQASASEAKVTPEAKALLDAVAAAYKGLEHYSDQGTVTVVSSVEGRPNKQTEKKTMAYSRPGKLRAEFGPVLLVTDGKTQTSVLGDRYLTTGALGPLSAEALSRNPAAVNYFTGATGMPSMALFWLLTSDDAAKALMKGVAKLSTEKPKVVSELPHDSLLMESESGLKVRFLVHPKTKLLGRVEVMPSLEDLPPGLKLEELSWNSGAISTAAPPEGTFVYQPPKDAKKTASIGELMAQPEAEATTGPSLEGKPSPDFTVTLLTEGEKPERVTLADYRGKVLVVDFWATWCGPCLRELPEIATMISNYAKGPSADKVRVLALSIDEGDPEKLDEVKTLVRKTLADGKIELQHGKVGQIGLDPTNTAARAFNVEAIPMTLVIDGEGIVRHVHVGYDEALPATLEKEINGLLGTQQK